MLTAVKKERLEWQWFLVAVTTFKVVETVGRSRTKSGT